MEITGKPGKAAGRRLSVGLLPLLHSLQNALGFIPRAAVPAIAEALNLSRAEVHGVVSYYPHLREQPHGRTLIQVCRAEACKSRGGDALFAHAQETLGCQAHGTSADGSVTLEVQGDPDKFMSLFAMIQKSDYIQITGIRQKDIPPDPWERGFSVKGY